MTTAEDTIHAQYARLLRSLRRDSRVSLVTISQWCGILYERKEGEGPLLDATHAALSAPWDEDTARLAQTRLNRMARNTTKPGVSAVAKFERN